ncbi:RNA polymerase sigma factor [Streptomyces umbrinus]|uniref:RNA polymerase sigma factor n=1 Tax=Streptomyces umbrinus TaxID=67370 RepID=UPI0033C1D282
MTEQVQETAHAEAVSALFAERGRQMVGYARKRLSAFGVPQGWADPEDVVQNALASVLRRERVEQLRPYVFRVIENEAWRAAQRYSVCRKDRSLDADVQLEAAGLVIDPYTAADRRLDLEDVLGALPPQQRRAVLFHNVLGLTQAETAQAMGVVPGTVATHVSRAHLTLRVTLGTLALVLAVFTAAWLRTGTLPIDPAAGGDALERLRSSLAAAGGIVVALVLVWLLWRPLILAASVLEVLWKQLVAQPAQRVAAWIRARRTDRDDEAGVRPPAEESGWAPARSVAYGRSEDLHDSD